MLPVTAIPLIILPMTVIPLGGGGGGVKDIASVTDTNSGCH